MNIEQIADEIYTKMLGIFGTEDAEYFAKQFLAAWLEQQEPAAIYAGVEGDNGYEVITTFVDIPDLAPLFLAPPPAIPSCTNDDSWNCKYCDKTATCEALKDQRNFAQPKQTAIPDHMCLVPLEPTERMLEEAYVLGNCMLQATNKCDPALLYKAMIAVAQGEQE